MSQYAVQDGSDQWQRARSSCDVTGSNFAAACGLDDSRSRMKFWRVRRGLEREERPPAFVQAYLDGGKEDEPFAATAFALSGLLAPAHLLCHDGQHTRRYAGFQWGTNNDRVELAPHKRLGYEPVALLEIKTVQREVHEGDEPVYALPDALVKNAMQLLLQLWCRRLSYGRLFYWHRATGCYRCFELSLLDSHAFADGPLRWALETLRSAEEPKRMDAKLKLERRKYVLDRFFIGASKKRKRESPDEDSAEAE